MGRVRGDAGGKVRASRHRGIRFYHAQHEQELRSLSMRPDEPPPVDPKLEAARTPSSSAMGRPVPPGGAFPFRAYGQVQGRRLTRSGR